MSRFGDNILLSELASHRCPNDDSLFTFFSYHVPSSAVKQYSIPLASPPHKMPYYSPFTFIYANRNIMFFVEPHPKLSYVHKSVDDGATWERITVPMEFTSFFSITDSVFIGTAEDSMRTMRLVRTGDAGTTWSVDSSFDIRWEHVAFDKGEDEKGVYCMLGVSSFQWVSDDSGKTWLQTTEIPWTGTFESRTAAITHTSRKHWTVLGKGSEVFETTDNGATWTQIRELPPIALISSTYMAGIARIEPDILVANRKACEFIRSENGGDTWSEIRTSEPRDFKRLHFFDANHGVAVGRSLTGISAMFRSIDGGLHWDRTLDSAYGLVDLRSYDDIRALRIDSTETATIVEILKTSDQGVSWTMEKRAEIEKWLRPAYNFFVLDDLYVLVNRYQNPVGVYISTDLGASWEKRVAPTQYFGTAVPLVLTRNRTGEIVTYASWFVGGSEERIFRSSDTCLTWEPIFDRSIFSMTSTLNELDAIGDTVITRGTKILGPGKSSELIAISTNGGQTWEILAEMQSPALWHSHNYYYFPTIISVGGANILKTSDNWLTHHILLDEDINISGDVCFLDSVNAWVANGLAIFRTTNGGTSWTEMPFTVQEDAAITAIYPNPVMAGQSVAVEIHLPIVGAQPFEAQESHAAPTGVRRTPLHIAIYDLLGRTVAVLYNGPADPGTRTLTWNPAPTLPTGMYVVRMSHGEKVWAKQVAVVR